MKKVNFLVKLSLAMLLGLVFITSSCKKDDPKTTTPPVIVLDGVYVKGAATAYADFDAKAMMKVAKNEVLQENRASLLELYIPIKAGADGFNIVQVTGSTRQVFGPGTGFANVTKGTIDEPQVTFQRGAVSATSTTKFTVPTDGMYHVVIDLVLLKAVIVPVHWGVIGAATPNGWGGSTDLTESAFNLTDMSWTLTNIELKKADWKFRYSSGWKVELDTILDLGSGKKGVKANTNLGGAISALVAGGDNMSNATPGIYTLTLAYKLGTGYTATVVKTGDVATKDYTNYEMGIIGNAYLKADGVTIGNWDEPFPLVPVVPVVAAKVFTWTYTLNLIKDGEFKFRQQMAPPADPWSGKSIGFADVTLAGTAAANFVDGLPDHNFKVVAAGNYTLVLKIDATTETYTVTATKN